MNCERPIQVRLFVKSVYFEYMKMMAHASFHIWIITRQINTIGWPTDSRHRFIIGPFFKTKIYELLFETIMLQNLLHIAKQGLVSLIILVISTYSEFKWHMSC